MNANGEKPLSYAQQEFDAKVTVLLANDEPDALRLLLQDAGPIVRSELIRKYQHIFSREDAEDVLMVAVESLWNARADFDRSKGSVMGWLRKIALNAAANLARSAWYRERTREQRMAPSQLDRLPAAARQHYQQAATLEPPECIQSTKYKQLADALARLPRMYRDILMADAASSAGRIDSGELAEEWGVSRATVRSRRHRARLRLVEELERLRLVEELERLRLVEKLETDWGGEICSAPSRQPNDKRPALRNGVE